MTTYLYETIPNKDGEVVKHYELKQSMNDNPFTRHPETGEPIRRVILGGWGLKKGASTIAPLKNDCGCGPAGCC
jgi:predicted nucleic acid-binding Zn ribbon protein